MDDIYEVVWEAVYNRLEQYRKDVIEVEKNLEKINFPKNFYCDNDECISSKEKLKEMLYNGLDGNFMEEVFKELDKIR